MRCAYVGIFWQFVMIFSDFLRPGYRAVRTNLRAKICLTPHPDTEAAGRPKFCPDMEGQNRKFRCQASVPIAGGSSWNSPFVFVPLLVSVNSKWLFPIPNRRRPRIYLEFYLDPSSMEEARNTIIEYYDFLDYFVTSTSTVGHSHRT